jgi:hypothetical protein
MVRTKLKKIYYISGIISLTILPIIFIHYAHKAIRDKTPTSITVFFADSNYIKSHVWLVNRHLPPKRNYSEIVINGNNLNDKIKLDFTQVRIREIFSQKDTLNGSPFVF